MTTGCLGQSLSDDLVKILIVVILFIIVILLFLISIELGESLYVLLCILNIRRTLAFYCLFFRECLLLDLDIGMCDHTTFATVPGTSTDEQSTGSEDEPLLVGVSCSGSSSLILPFPPLFLLLSNSSLHGLGSRQTWVGTHSCGQLSDVGQNTLQASVSL